MRLETAVPIAYAGLWLSVAVAGILGGGHLVAVVLIPVGAIMAIGALCVALDVGHSAETMGADAERRFREGEWWQRLQLALEPDQVRRYRNVATAHIFFGFLLAVIGIYAVTA